MRVSQHSDKSASTSRSTPSPAAAPADCYAQLHDRFEWLVPEKFNIAQVCCARWAALPDAAKRVAIHAMDAGAGAEFHTYFDLQQQANRLSHVLSVLGVT
ncbi:MAG: AMP-binding protein, partial [Rhodoferax sp.]